MTAGLLTLLIIGLVLGALYRVSRPAPGPWGCKCGDPTWWKCMCVTRHCRSCCVHQKLKRK